METLKKYWWALLVIIFVLRFYNKSKQRRSRLEQNMFTRGLSWEDFGSNKRKVMRSFMYNSRKRSLKALKYKLSRKFR
jgi:hypothetical protein